MRPSLSLIDESARPSIVNLGKPAAVSVSTRTRWASTPTTAAVRDVASMTLRSAGKRGRACAQHGEPRRAVGQRRSGSAASGAGSVGSVGEEGEGLAGGDPRGPQPVAGFQLLGRGGVFWCE